MSSRIVMISCVVVSLFVGCGDDKGDPAPIRASKFAEEYAREKFKDLSKHPDLERLFTDFAAISHAHVFMRDEATKKLYHEIVVTTFGKETQKDVIHAMFENYLLYITPPEILLEAMVPELGPKGKLHGILEAESSDTSRRLERQSPDGYPGEPDFRHYASYLKNHKNVETSSYLMRHMFRTAPGEALHAMIYVQHLGVPYPPLRLSKSPTVNAEIRPLVYAEHILSDVIWHQQFRFDVSPDQLTKAKSELSVLSQHKEWWVRLYVAEIMQQHPELRVADAMERLKQDEHELVKQAITRTEISRGMETTVDPPNTQPK